MQARTLTTRHCTGLKISDLVLTTNLKLNLKCTVIVIKLLELSYMVIEM